MTSLQHQSPSPQIPKRNQKFTNLPGYDDSGEHQFVSSLGKTTMTSAAVAGGEEGAMSSSSFAGTSATRREEEAERRLSAGHHSSASGSQNTASGSIIETVSSLDAAPKDTLLDSFAKSMHAPSDDNTAPIKRSYFSSSSSLLHQHENVSHASIPAKSAIQMQLKKRFIEVGEALGADATKEALIGERMRFLQREMQLLEKELGTLPEEEQQGNDNTSSSSTNDDHTTTQFSSELKQMRQQLEQLRRDSGRNNLSQQLKQLKNGAPVSGTAKSSSTSESTPPLSSMQAFESRITKLERILSTSTYDILQPANVNNLEATLTTIEQQLDLLDDNTLNSLRTRIKDINHELSLVDSQERETNHVNAKKINSLYHSIKQWNTFAHEVPRVIDRLYTLKGLHDDELDFMSEFKELKEKRHSLEEMLHNQKDVLNTVNKNFDKNVSIFEENMKKLDDRMEKISQWKDSKR